MRPLRAGDYSFNQIGPTGLYMLLSNIPAEERKRRGYYAVGGCGGNIAWHTPDDLMPVADLEILRRDLAVYLTTIVRIVNAPLHPVRLRRGGGRDPRRRRRSIRRQPAARSTSAPIVRGPRGARATKCAHGVGDATRAWRRQPRDSERRQANALLRRIARPLVPLNYARGERFDHDPALKFGPVPRLEAAASIGSAAPELRPFIRTALLRERNKIRAMLRSLRREVRAASEQRALNGTPA